MEAKRRENFKFKYSIYCSDLTWKLLVFWKTGCKREVVAYDFFLIFWFSKFWCACNSEYLDLWLTLTAPRDCILSK